MLNKPETNDWLTVAVPEGELTKIANGHLTFGELIVNVGSYRDPARFPSWPWLACALLSALTFCTPPLKAQQKLSPQQVNEIRELSATTLTREGLPGLAIAVSKGDQVWSAGFGSADL